MFLRIFWVIVSLPLPVLLWLWTSAKRLLDWHGRGAGVADLANPDGLTAQALRWLFATPWWVPAVLATAATIWWIWLTYRLLHSASPTAASPEKATPSNGSAREVGRGGLTCAKGNAASKGRVAFDYSTYNGRVEVGSKERRFVLRFSKANNVCIHFYKDTTNLRWIARVKDKIKGSSIDIDGVDRTSGSYTVHTGEIFLAQNLSGYLLQGRIRGIKDDGRGSDQDEVDFSYHIVADPAPSPLRVLV
jgi:hypothetical protein